MHSPTEDILAMISTSYSPSCQGTASWFPGVAWGGGGRGLKMNISSSHSVQVNQSLRWSLCAFWIITSGWGWHTRHRPLCQMKWFIILVSWWTFPGCLLDTGTLMNRWDNGKNHPWALEGFLLCETDYLSWLYMKGSEGDGTRCHGSLLSLKGQ